MHRHSIFLPAWKYVIFQPRACSKTNQLQTLFFLESCVFVEMATGRALLPGKSNLHQLELTLRLLGGLSLQQTERMQLNHEMHHLCFASAAGSAVPSLLRLQQRYTPFFKIFF